MEEANLAKLRREASWLSSRAFTGARRRAFVEVRLDVPQESAPPREHRSNPSGQVHGRPACFTLGLAPASHVLSAASLDASAIESTTHAWFFPRRTLYPFFPREHMWRQPCGTRIPPYPLLASSTPLPAWERKSGCRQFVSDWRSWVASQPSHAAAQRGVVIKLFFITPTFSTLYHQSSTLFNHLLWFVLLVLRTLAHCFNICLSGLLKVCSRPFSFPTFLHSLHHPAQACRPQPVVPRLLRPASTPTLALTAASSWFQDVCPTHPGASCYPSCHHGPNTARCCTTLSGPLDGLSIRRAVRDSSQWSRVSLAEWCSHSRALE